MHETFIIMSITASVIGVIGFSGWMSIQIAKAKLSQQHKIYKDQEIKEYEERLDVWERKWEQYKHDRDQRHNDEIHDLKAKLRDAEKLTVINEREVNLRITEALNKLKSEMTTALTTSDMQRVEAQSALKAYKEIDNKTDHEKLLSMFDKAITGLSSNKPEVHVLSAK